MPSFHKYTAEELPAAYAPHGFEWMVDRLLAVGYTNPRVGASPREGLFFIQVDELHISNNQLKFDVTPSTQLTVDRSSFNIAPGGRDAVQVRGPAGTEISVRFSGLSFTIMESFTILDSGAYNFQINACPANQRVLDPQLYDFYVPGTSVSPVAVWVTFR